MRKILMIVFIICGSFGAAFGAKHQTQKTKVNSDEEMARALSRQCSESLTVLQRSKLLSLSECAALKMRSIQTDNSLSDEDRAKYLLALKRKYQTESRLVLDNRQRSIYDKMQSILIKRAKNK